MSGTLGFIIYFFLHLTHFSLVLGSVVIYKIYWEACAELFTTCVGLLGISAVEFGEEDLSFQVVVYCSNPVWQRTYNDQSKIGIRMCSLSK